MVFKRNDSINRRLQSSEPALSPRFARLVRESWWLLVVAACLYLALILATYAKSDPGWSFSGIGRAACQSRRRRRRVARGPAALSVRPVGLVVGDRRRRAGRRRLSPRGAARRRDGPSVGVWVRSVSRSCSRQRSARGDPAVEAAGVAAAGAGRRARRRIGQGLRARIGFNGATLLLLALFAVGSSLLFGISWLRVMERIGAGIEAADRRGAPSPRGRARPQDRRRGHDGTRARRRAIARGRGGARAGGGRAAGGARAEVRARREGKAAAAVHRHARFAAAAAGAARGRAVDAGIGQHRDARIHVAAHRTQAGRLRRQRQGAGRLSRAGDHALRDRARRRREGRADRQPDQGPRARAVGGVDPRGRDHSRQVVHGPRTAQSAPAGGEAGRDPVVDDVQRHAGRADAGAGQGHRRQAGGRRPGADAAPAGRGHHGLGQVGRGQRDDPVAALQGRAEAGAPDPDRSQDARTVDVRGHSASAGAGGHQHEARPQRAQLVRRRDGAALQADVDARRAQPRRLQRQDRRGPQGRQEGTESVVADAGDTRSRSRRCR